MQEYKVSETYTLKDGVTSGWDMLHKGCYNTNNGILRKYPKRTVGLLKEWVVGKIFKFAASELEDENIEPPCDEHGNVTIKKSDGSTKTYRERQFISLQATAIMAKAYVTLQVNADKASRMKKEKKARQQKVMQRHEDTLGLSAERASAAKPQKRAKHSVGLNREEPIDAHNVIAWSHDKNRREGCIETEGKRGCNFDPELIGLSDSLQGLVESSNNFGERLLQALPPRAPTAPEQVISESERTFQEHQKKRSVLHDIEAALQNPQMMQDEKATLEEAKLKIQRSMIDFFRNYAK
jgi:hypothetical protein